MRDRVNAGRGQRAYHAARGIDAADEKAPSRLRPFLLQARTAPEAVAAFGEGGAEGEVRALAVHDAHRPVDEEKHGGAVLERALVNDLVGRPQPDGQRL